MGRWPPGLLVADFDASIKGRSGDVRFTSESGHVRCSERCPLRANSGHGTNLLNNLIGALLERRGHVKAERLRSLQIDHKLELGRL